MNAQCATCPKAVNAINGRYCTLIKKYVEYTQTPPCHESKDPLPPRR